MPWVRCALEEWLVDNAGEADAQRFAKRWSRVRPGVDALPCPNCFLEGDDRTLAPMDVQQGVMVTLRPWRCAHCEERFDVPIEG
jgi:hypothetical protein